MASSLDRSVGLLLEDPGVYWGPGV